MAGENDGRRGSAVNWRGLLRWSLSQMDASRPFPQVSVSDERRRWFEEAMEDAQAAVGTMAQRMRDITLLLRSSSSSSSSSSSLHLEELLDQLHEHVESIDIANGVAG